MDLTARLYAITVSQFKKIEETERQFTGGEVILNTKPQNGQAGTFSARIIYDPQKLEGVVLFCKHEVLIDRYITKRAI